MKTLGNVSIRAKLIVLFLVVGLVPCAVIAKSGQSGASHALKGAAENAQKELAAGASDKLDRNLFERYGDVQAFAKSDPAKSMDAARLTRFMNTMMGTYTPIYKLMVVADMHGRIVAANSVDLGGRPLSTRSLIGQDVRGESWFETASAGRLKDGESLVQDLHRDDLMAKAYGDGDSSDAMSFTYPIKDDAGHIVGVWSNRFNWDLATSILNAVLKRAHDQGAKSTNAILLSSKGVVLADGNPDDTLTTRLASNPVAAAALRDGASGGTEAGALVGAHKAQVLGYFHSTGYSIYPGIGWGIVSSQSRSEALKPATNLSHKALLITLIAALLIGGVAFLVSRIAARKLRQIRDYCDFTGRVSEGDLSARLEVDGEDEFAQLGAHLNDMVESLASLSGEVLANAQAVSTSATQILSTVSQQTAGASQQSAAINQTTTATEEIRATAQQAAEKANEVADQAQDALRASDEGAEAVEAIIDGMADIRAKVEAIAGDVEALSAQTAQIGAITHAVNDLADQSNLLALNATIEAARAGEHGKGFAVVADEVRNLAEQSKQATAQVQSILQEIEQATRAAVSAAHEGTEVVEQGTQLAERAGDIIAQLAEANGVAAQSAQQIAASVAQQTAGMDQIATGMREASQATSEFVEGVQHSQEAAEGLNQVAGELQALASRYRV
ncbi:MAG: methyl-accepting chemotaxis protein [Thermoleophilaceae bacterium]